MNDLFLKVKIHQEQNLPFVIYSKPNSNVVVGIFQNDDHVNFVNNFDEKGFVFAPFEGENYILIPSKASTFMVERIEFLGHTTEPTVFHEYNDLAKVDFENLVKKALHEIELGIFKKVVLSRKESVQLESIDLILFFKRLLENYPSAFKYCFFHPKVGIWMGATPEQLMKIKDFEIQTVALAGTRLFKGKEDIKWNQKEVEEQQFVTDFILENLKEFVTEETVSSPYTKRAGNLLHIKTDIAAKLNSHKDIKDVIKVLHPTPAVCGYPKFLTKEFILENEPYDREFYAGFLGELNFDFVNETEASDLFVNLRCMKLSNNKADLYVGCGITKDSVPEDEFFETVNKSMTMKKIVY